MFPGGANPDHTRRMQGQADTAWRYYETVGEIVRSSGLRCYSANAARLSAEQESVKLSAETMRVPSSVERALDSSGLLLAGRLVAKTGATKGETS